MADAIVHNNDLKVEVSTRQVFRIALPITLAMLVPQINFVANTVFLSRIGERELGAAGIVGIYYLIFAVVGSGLNNGMQALIARRAGEDRPQEIGKMFAQSLWVAMGFALFGILFTHLFSSYFFTAVLQNPAIRAEAISFVHIRIWGLPLLYLFQACNALLVGTNNSRYMKYAFIVESSLNILLDYILIYGHFGFPAIGFNGAAIASLVAEGAGFGIVMIVILYKKFHHRFELFRFTRFNSSLSGLIFRQSSPLVMQYILSISAWLMFYLLIEKYGERPLAISNTMRNMFGVCGVFIWAFASTTNAMVSNIIGQQRKGEVLFLIGKIARLSFLFATGICILLNLFPGLILSIYSSDPGFIAAATPVLRLVSVSLLFMSVGTVWLNGVTGTANSTVNMIIEFITAIIYCLYIYLVLHVWRLSLAWGWASEFVYWTCLFTMSYWYLKSGKWKKKEI